MVRNRVVRASCAFMLLIVIYYHKCGNVGNVYVYLYLIYRMYRQVRYLPEVIEVISTGKLCGSPTSSDFKIDGGTVIT